MVYGGCIYLYWESGDALSSTPYKLACLTIMDHCFAMIQLPDIGLYCGLADAQKKKFTCLVRTLVCTRSDHHNVATAPTGRATFPDGRMGNKFVAGGQYPNVRHLV